MYNSGYRYYVYVAPGVIEYFETIEEAQNFAQETGGLIGEMN